MSDNREQVGIGTIQTLALGLMMPAPDMSGPTLGIIGTIPVTRADLLKRVERWTQGRKVSLCRGLCAEIVTTSEVVAVHGLAQDEIDRWMEAYKGKDFEALKAGYRRKRAAVGYAHNLCTSQASPQRGHEPAAARADHVATRKRTTPSQPVRR